MMHLLNLDRSIIDDRRVKTYRGNGMRLLRMSPRRWLIATAFVVLSIGGWQYAIWYGYRAMLRSQAAYHAETQGFYEAHERELRAEIARIRKGSDHADRAFELLRSSRVANASCEVASWAKSPRSKERTAIALKWAEVAANEAAYMAALHRRWGQDLARGHMPHHVTDEEIDPFKMPIGWTPDDPRQGD